MNLCCVCCWGAKRRSRISRVSIVRRRRTGGGEREKEEKYWPWRHILKQLNRNYSHLLFRSFWSFFSPLISVCVSQQKKNLRRERNSGSKSTPLLLTLFPVCFLVDFFREGATSRGRSRASQPRREPWRREKSSWSWFRLRLHFLPKHNIIWRVSNSMFVVVLCCTHNLPR